MTEPWENELRKSLAESYSKTSQPNMPNHKEMMPRSTLPKHALADITNTVGASNVSRQTVKPNQQKYVCLAEARQSAWERRAMEKSPSDQSHLDSIDMMNSELKKVLKDEPRSRGDSGHSFEVQEENKHPKERSSNHDHTFQEVCERITTITASPAPLSNNPHNKLEPYDEKKMMAYLKRLEAEHDDQASISNTSFEAKVMVVDYSQRKEVRSEKSKSRTYNDEQFMNLMLQVDRALETKDSQSTFQSLPHQSYFNFNASNSSDPKETLTSQQTKPLNMQRNPIINKNHNVSTKSNVTNPQVADRNSSREEFSLSREDTLTTVPNGTKKVKNQSIQEHNRKPKLAPEEAIKREKSISPPQRPSVTLQAPQPSGMTSGRSNTGRFNVSGKSIIINNPRPSHSPQPAQVAPAIQERSISRSPSPEVAKHHNARKKPKSQLTQSMLELSDNKNLTFEEQEELTHHLVEMKLAELRGKLTFLMSKKPKECAVFFNLVKQTLYDFINDRVYKSCHKNYQDVCLKVQHLLEKVREVGKIVKNGGLKTDEKFQQLMIDNIASDVHELIKSLGSFVSGYSSVKDESKYKSGESHASTQNQYASGSQNKEMEAMMRKSEEFVRRKEEQAGQNNPKGAKLQTGHSQPSDKQANSKYIVVDTGHKLKLPENSMQNQQGNINGFVSKMPGKPAGASQLPYGNQAHQQGLYRSVDSKQEVGRVPHHTVGTMAPGPSINRNQIQYDDFGQLQHAYPYQAPFGYHNQFAEADFLLSQKFGCRVFCIKIVQKSLVCGFEDGGLSVFSINKSEGLNLERSNKLHARSISSLTCTPLHHKKLLLFTGYAGSTEASIVVWDFQTLKPMKELCGHTATISCLEYIMPNYLVSCSFDRKVIFWDLNECEAVLCTEVHNAPILSAHYDTESKILYTGSLDSTIVSAGLVFDEGELVDCRILKTINGSGPVLLLTSYLGDKLLSFQSSKIVIYDSRGMLFRELKTNTLPNTLEMVNEDQGLFVDVQGKPHWLNLGEYINNRKPIEFNQVDRGSMEKSSTLMGMRLNGAYPKAQFYQEPHSTLVISLNDKNDTVFFFKIK
jgi:hypothetical protein